MVDYMDSSFLIPKILVKFLWVTPTGLPNTGEVVKNQRFSINMSLYRRKDRPTLSDTR